MSWAMQRVAAAGFLPHGTPDLVRATVLEKCGFQPRGDNTQVHCKEERMSSEPSCCAASRHRHLTVALTLMALQPWRRGSMCVGVQGLAHLRQHSAVSSRDCAGSLKCQWPPHTLLQWQVYSIAGSPLCLTGTAEVPLAGLHMDAVLPGGALPLRLAAFGRAFRTEAGAAGSASRGLYRLHQFSKVGGVGASVSVSIVGIRAVRSDCCC